MSGVDRNPFQNANPYANLELSGAGQSTEKLLGNRNMLQKSNNVAVLGPLKQSNSTKLKKVPVLQTLNGRTVGPKIKEDPLLEKLRKKAARQKTGRIANEKDCAMFDQQYLSSVTD